MEEGAKPSANGAVGKGSTRSGIVEEARRIAEAVRKTPHEHRRELVLCFVMCALVASVPPFVGIPGGYCAPVLSLVYAAVFWVRHRKREELRFISAASNQRFRGNAEVATALLDGTAPFRFLFLEQRRNSLRVEIALEQGDLASCLALLDAPVPEPLRTPGMFDVRALATRSIALAAAGDLERARAQAASARSALSRASLGPYVLLGEQVVAGPQIQLAMAEAILLFKTGESTRLREHLTRHRRLVRTFASRRNRALFDGLMGAVRQRVASPYRLVDSPAESGGAQEPDDWVIRVLPELAPFLEVPRPGAGWRARPSPGSPGERRGSTQRAARTIPDDRRSDAREPPAVSWQWRLARGASVAAIVVAFCVGSLVLGLLNGRHPHHLGAAGAIVLLVCALPMAATRIARLFSRIPPEQLALERAYHFAGEGEEELAESILREVAARRVAPYAVRAELSLAQRAAWRADHEEALRHLEGARALAANPDPFTATLDDEIRGLTAVALAGLGRFEEAAHALKALPARWPGMTTARFRTQLLGHLVQGNLEEAGRLVRDRPAREEADVRTDLLADLVSAATSSTSPGELARLRDELDDQEQRAFVARICPALLTAFAAASQWRDDDAERTAAAEHEQRAEAEAEEAVATAQRLASR